MRYIVRVTFDSNQVHSIRAIDNQDIEFIDIPDLATAPKFVSERFALLRLTDVNKSRKGERIGRKLEEDVIVIYISYDEYQQIKEECK